MTNKQQHILPQNKTSKKVDASVCSARSAFLKSEEAAAAVTKKNQQQ